VIPAEGHAVDEHALREHCYARVTRYKVPRKIVAVDDLPRSMLGKILRRKVREQLIASGEFDKKHTLAQLRVRASRQKTVFYTSCMTLNP